MTTFAEIIDFVMKNRGNSPKAFRGYTEVDIIKAVQASLEEVPPAILVVRDYVHGDIVGFAHGYTYWSSERHETVLHVENILTTSPFVLHQLFEEFRHRWPNLNLSGERKKGGARVMQHYQSQDLSRHLQMPSVNP